ncbi:hypothetical protein ABID81_002090 [Frigoribacterium sp. PvP054]
MVTFPTGGGHRLPASPPVSASTWGQFLPGAAAPSGAPRFASRARAPVRSCPSPVGLAGKSCPVPPRRPGRPGSRPGPVHRSGVARRRLAVPAGPARCRRAVRGAPVRAPGPCTGQELPVAGWRCRQVLPGAAAPSGAPRFVPRARAPVRSCPSSAGGAGKSCPVPPRRPGRAGSCPGPVHRSGVARRRPAWARGVATRPRVGTGSPCPPERVARGTAGVARTPIRVICPPNGGHCQQPGPSLGAPET